MRPIAEEVRNHSVACLPEPRFGLIKDDPEGIATKTAASWIKSATSTAVASDGAVTRPQTGRGSAVSPRVDTENII